jgi:DNA-directed RNA polymerase specialized sigma24 family protein/ribosome-associated translation inhibitor RaiA
MKLSWNLVSKKIHPHEQLRARVRSKVLKLERELQSFPAAGVHLKITISRHPHNRQFTVGLMLILPPKLLRSKKSAADPIAALDLSIKALEREVARLKVIPRRGTPRPTAAAEASLMPSQLWSEPLPADGQPEKEIISSLREAVAEQYAPLLYYLRREIGRAESEGWAPRGTIDAEAVADEVTCQAFAARDSKPPEQSHRVWLYALARRELQRRFREFEDQTRTSVSLESELAVTDAEVDNEPLVMAEGPLHGDAIELRDLTPDTHSLPPDAEAADHDLAEYLRSLARAWPSDERAVFELHFLEGFEADEVAMLEKLEMARVHGLIEVVQQRLRQALTEAVQAKATARLRTSSGRAADLAMARA